MNECEYCAIEGFYGKKIQETEHWIIFLAPSQRYLGTCVVSLKRQCRNLMELNNDEWVEFGKIVQMMEKALDDVLSPSLFNWSCFKNAAFRAKNPKPEIHWHFLPRYKDPVKYRGITFQDPDFGYIPQPITFKIPSDVMVDLLNLMKSAMDKYPI
jgi:diadenosine tetraphosphate (Ap4A) HIT family hydrolase